MKLRSLFALTVSIMLFAFLSYQFFDQAVILMLVKHSSPLLTSMGQIIQHLFSFKVWTPLACLSLIFLWWEEGSVKSILGKRSTAFWIGIVIAMGITTVLKFSFGRYRPELFLQAPQHLYGFIGFVTQPHFDLITSMPSDHAAVIFSIVTGFCFLVRSFLWRILFCLCGIVLVSFRVIYLRHYPSDVMVGALVGVWAMNLAYLICKVKVE